ncbi:hypothetical protein Adt_34991 [Abeliophyllum distichum]|uniref:Uncharacterized protein n=1 Tax=Abeliophyllum distichum TaxID=126358 RepID=A0ABD1QDG8_9LAMI
MAKASKLEEYRQAMEGLHVAGCCGEYAQAYEQLHADLKESEANVLYLTKKLDDASAAQKVTTEALDEETKSGRDEAENLMRSLKASEKGRNEAETEVAKLLTEKKELEGKLENVEVEFVATFHNTDANGDYGIARIVSFHRHWAHEIYPQLGEGPGARYCG